MELVDKLGQPSIYDPRPGGLALWNKRNLSNKTCICEIMVRDENVQHLCPEPHKDFLYSCVNVELQPTDIAKISQLTGSVFYDPIKQQLTARCGSLSANIATLKIATDLVAGKVTINTIHTNGLYKQSITNSVNVEKLKEIYAGLCANVEALRRA